MRRTIRLLSSHYNKAPGLSKTLASDSEIGLSVVHNRTGFVELVTGTTFGHIRNTRPPLFVILGKVEEDLG